jgi:hypothetical protein
LVAVQVAQELGKVLGPNRGEMSLLPRFHRFVQILCRVVLEVATALGVLEDTRTVLRKALHDFERAPLLDCTDRFQLCAFAKLPTFKDGNVRLSTISQRCQVSDAPETLDLEGIARLFGAEAETIAQYARSGELPGTRIGKGWIFLRADALTFLRERINRDTEARRSVHYRRDCAAQKNGPRGSEQTTGLLFERPPRRRRTALPELPLLPSGPQQSPKVRS